MTLSVLVIGGALLAACAPAPPPPPPPPPPTRGSTFPYQPPPSAFVEVARPEGASSTPGASHWYRAPTGDGHAVELGVYLPASPATPLRTVLVLHGGDGLRRRYEDLARGYALQGDIGVVGCWFDQPEAALGDDAVSCSGGPTFKGTETGAVADVNTLIAALAQVPIAPLAAAPAMIDVSKLAIVGHSYGAGVALMRSADGFGNEPIVASSGLYTSNPAVGAPRPGDRYPTSFVRAISGPVQVLHGAADNIIPLSDAQTFIAGLTSAGHPPDSEIFPTPAGHSFPWQTDSDPDFSRTTFASRFLAASGTWIDARLP